jgi:hypothetical protein
VVGKFGGTLKSVGVKVGVEDESEVIGKKDHKRLVLISQDLRLLYKR